MDAITIISHKVNESFVEQRQSDGYVNATALTRAYKLATGKRRDVGHWLELERTKETLQHLSSITGIPVIELYQVFRGSPSNGGGTWIHPKLAVRFGIWLSDEFGYLVEQWVCDWLVTGQSQALHSRITQLENKLEIAFEAITSLTSANAQLQSQVQNLLPISSDFMPPGWDADVWKKLLPQDKRHFRFLFRRRGFRPSNQGKQEAVSLPALGTEQMKQKQIQELKQAVGEILPEEKKRLEAAKQEALRKLWSSPVDSDGTAARVTGSLDG
ncbi:MAG: KilA-N domain-containing protein [Nostocaceae cyanobacterium]|nr:KilA-N domain-containing protein [Nostocaceae cyanobacterium]